MTREPIVIHRSVTGAGATYALDWRSAERLQKQLAGEVHVRPRIFIAHGTEADYERVQGNLVGQIIQLLTGVTEERLQPLGEVIFRDPVTEQEVARAS